MYIPNEPPPFSDTLLSDLLTESKFREIVRSGYVYHASFAGLCPEFSRSVMQDAYQCYKSDIERLDANMKTFPDHFKHAGCLAYWLRRHYPVFKWREADAMLPEKHEEARKFFIDYGHVFQAFNMGYEICLYFERHRIPVIQNPPRDVDKDYVQTVCYLMKYKNISPHAMGFIYRSLFFV